MPGPVGGAYSAPPGPLVGLRGKGAWERGRGGSGREGKRERKEGKGRTPPMSEVR